MNQKHVAGFSILSVPQHETFLKNFFTIEHAQCTKLFNMCCPLYSFIKQPPFDIFFFFFFFCFYSNLFQQIGVQKKVKNQVFICKCLKEILASLCLFMFEYLKLFFFFLVDFVALHSIPFATQSMVLTHGCQHQNKQTRVFKGHGYRNTHTPAEQQSCFALRGYMSRSRIIPNVPYETL